MKFQLLSLLLTVTAVVGDGDVTSAGEVSTVPSVGGTDVNDTLLLSASRPEDQLYNDIVLERFDNALSIVEGFKKWGGIHLVKTTIDKLIGHRRSNVGAFAYKLFAAGNRKIVEDQFPGPYRMVFNDSLIKITNNKYGLPIEFGRSVDREGDKDAYGKEGSANTNNYVWKLEPVLDGNKVYFKIHHYSENRYLKLGTSMDSDGDFQAYGSTNSDTDRHLWTFLPVDYNGQLSFCIINRAHYQALKFAVRAYQGNRQLFSTAGDFYNHPEPFGWQIEVITGSVTYRL